MDNKHEYDEEELRNNAKYNKAEKLLQSGRKSKIGEARRIYDSLGDWRDSPEKIKECDEALKKADKKITITLVGVVAVLLLVGIGSYAAYYNKTEEVSNKYYDTSSSDYSSTDSSGSSSSSTSSSSTSSHICIVDGCYKTATHVLNGTSGIEYYCDEHYEWMEDFAQEITDTANEYYSSESHDCAICGDDANYEDPHDAGIWYCYEHYLDALEWYMDN